MVGNIFLNMLYNDDDDDDELEFIIPLAMEVDELIVMAVDLISQAVGRRTFLAIYGFDENGEPNIGGDYSENILLGTIYCPDTRLEYPEYIITPAGTFDLVFFRDGHILDDDVSLTIPARRMLDIKECRFFEEPELDITKMSKREYAKYLLGAPQRDAYFGYETKEYLINAIPQP